MNEQLYEKDPNYKTDYRWWEDEKKLGKLEMAFRIDASDEEACSIAEITVDQLYYYQREINPEFKEKKKVWKHLPTYKARQTVVEALEDKKNPEFALKYLERKRKLEFSTRSELTGADGKDIIQPLVISDILPRDAETQTQTDTSDRGGQ